MPLIRFKIFCLGNTLLTPRISLEAPAFANASTSLFHYVGRCRKSNIINAHPFFFFFCIFPFSSTKSVIKSSEFFGFFSRKRMSLQHRRWRELLKNKVLWWLIVVCLFFRLAPTFESLKSNHGSRPGSELWTVYLNGGEDAQPKQLWVLSSFTFFSLFMMFLLDLFLHLYHA